MDSLVLALTFGLRLLFAQHPPPSVDPPCAPGSVGPNLTPTSRGLLLSWLEPAGADAKPGDGVWSLRYALFSDGRWSAPRTIASGDRFFVNWADFPSVAEARGGWLLAHWAEKSGADTYAYDVALARADGVAGPWKRIASPHDDRTQTEHGFVSLVPEGEALRAFWLDGREMKAEGHGAGHGGHGSGDMTLRTARVTREGKIEAGAILDKRTCECCNTSAAVTSDGALIAFRDRSEKEVRDVSVVRQTASGWSGAETVASDRWEIAGCPVNGPAAAASGKTVAIAWFTAAGDRQTVRLAYSRDAGRSFAKPIDVDTAEPLGRVDLLLDSSGDAIVAWVGTSGGTSVRLRRVPAAGRAGPAATVAATTVDRASGFPQIAHVPGGDYLVVWVDAKAPASIRAAVVPEDSLR
jgi:hypothetical protein